jgi:hypothetical protein
MRQSRAAAKRRRNSFIFVCVLLTFVTVVIGGATYAFFHQPPGLDQQRFCPANGPLGHVVLLVDKTDPLDFTQKQAFQNSLEQLVTRGVAPGYLLSVFVLGEDYKANAAPVFERCNPGDGAGASVLTSNPAHLKKRFEQEFRGPMQRVVEELQATKSAKYSPIFEMLEMTAINGFRKQNVNGPRKLIIVSDMLHNTSGYTMYHGNPDFERFRQSDYGRKMSTDFNGVDVELQYLLNTPQLQTRRHLKFWEDYFSAAGARIVAVRPLEG